MYEFRDGHVKEHLGSISDFLESRRIENLQELERRFKPAAQPVASAAPEKTESKKDFEARKFVSKEEKKLRNRVDFLEKEISSIEKKMKDLEATLANPSENDDIMELTRSYLEYKRDLDAKTDEWGELLEKLG